MALAAICVALLASFPVAVEAKKKRARGIDVSRFQGTIDWPRVATSGIRFAFVQASRGNGFDCAVASEHCGPDPYFEFNRAGARANLVRVGAYHRAFASGRTLAEARADATLEADLFIAQVGRLNRGELVPVLDVETPFVGLNPKRLTAWIRRWVKRVRKRLGRKPMIYTNASSWARTKHTREFARARYPLWVAHWKVRKPRVPARNWAGRGWAVWQWTSSGKVPGISGRVDLNRLRVGLRKLTIRR